MRIQKLNFKTSGDEDTLFFGLKENGVVCVYDPDGDLMFAFDPKEKYNIFHAMVYALAEHFPMNNPYTGDLKYLVDDATEEEANHIKKANNFWESDWS